MTFLNITFYLESRKIHNRYLHKYYFRTLPIYFYNRKHNLKLNYVKVQNGGVKLKDVVFIPIWNLFLGFKFVNIFCQQL